MSHRGVFPRRLRFTLALAAVAIVAACLFADLRLRPRGEKRDGLWCLGLVAYAVLLDRAIGPAVDGGRGPGCR